MNSAARRVPHFVIQSGAGYVRDRLTLEMTSDPVEAARMTADCARSTVDRLNSAGFDAESIPVIHVPYRAAVPPAADPVRWSEAAESIVASSLRIAFAWQRVILRAWWGA
jgi:hypothetical protein